MKQTNPKSKIQYPKSKVLFLLITAIIVLALDQLTKAWVVANVAFQQPVSVIPGFLRLRYTENTGAAFGFFQGWTGVLSVAAIAIIVIIVMSASKVGANPLGMMALGLITGGALGNLTDRLRLGYVVDFVDVYGPRITLNNTHYTFPVFNVADSAITVGAIVLMATLIFGKEDRQIEANPAAMNTAPPVTDSLEIHTAQTTSAPSSLRAAPMGATPAGWAGLVVMLAGLFVIAFRQASKRL